MNIPISSINEKDHLDSSHITTFYEKSYKLMWVYMKGSPRQCFTIPMLDAMLYNYRKIRVKKRRYIGHNVQYMAVASGVQGVYNLGGDLELFSRLIVDGDRESLLNYGKKCIDAVFQAINFLDAGVEVMTLVEGHALGGGFEAVLAGNTSIVERGCELGCPEILFNLFPGMGAYNLLSEKVGSTRARQMILSGKRYLAEDLYDMGVIDVLAEKGEGKKALYQYIKRAERFSQGHAAVRAIRERYIPVQYEELLHIVELWVDTALSLTQKDLKMIKRLVCQQEKFQ